jgi:myo-inositol-1-phosphate synthase
VPPTGVTVQRGHTYDGLGKYYREMITESDDTAGRRRRRTARGPRRRPGVLPAGRLGDAAKFYAQCAIDAGWRSSTPCRSSSPAPPSGPRSSTDAGVPIVGDDIKSQVGATITHRVLAKLFEDRGVTVDRTYQLNVGGNMDFMNMLERERLESKKISKTQSVTSQLVGDIRPATCTSARVGLRRLARRPQVGVRAPRGSQLR